MKFPHLLSLTWARTGLWVFIIFLAMMSITPLRADDPPGPMKHGLLLSDIHFDPFADPTLVNQLIKSPVERWDAILQADKNAPFAAPKHDANYSLVISALENAKTEVSGDVVIYTGDILCHNFKDAFDKAGGKDTDYQGFAIKTAVYMIRKLQSTLQAPVVYAVGNNDSAEGDYVMSADNDMFAALAPELDVLASSPEARATFRHGGYYAIPYPTAPKQEVVVLNTVLWSNNYESGLPMLSDPGMEELMWLTSTLAQAKSQGQKVTLVMHIAPGDDAFYSASSQGAGKYIPLWKQDNTRDYVTLFSNIVQQYKDVVLVGFAGHTHTDDFKVMYDGATPYLPIRITPAVSPIYRNNPGFSEYDYDPDTTAVADIVTYQSPGSPGKPWLLEYRFSQAYDCPTFSAANLSLLTARIRSSDTTRATWEKYYDVMAPSAITETNWRYFSYAQTRFTPSEYAIGMQDRP